MKLLPSNRKLKQTLSGSKVVITIIRQVSVMTQGIISVFRNYNKTQLVVGAFVLLYTPSAASALPHPGFSSQKLLQQSEGSEV